MSNATAYAQVRWSRKIFQTRNETLRKCLMFALESAACEMCVDSAVHYLPSMPNVAML